MKNIIFDLTSRLPGPLSCSNFKQYNIDVLKIENYNDPFKTSSVECFNTWYQQINKNKEILKGNLKKLAIEHQPFLILSSRPPMTDEEKQIKTNWLVIKGNTNNKPLHDLNFWAEIGLIKNKTLPLLPFAGIIFSQIITSKILYYLSQRNLKENINQDQMIETLYLDQEVKSVLAPLLAANANTNKETLHQGKYPCYQIYNLIDGHLSVACIEEKFWVQFCKLFHFKLTSEDRFDECNQVKAMLTKYFLTKTTEQIREVLANHDLCVNIT